MELGKYNRLEVKTRSEIGVFLTDGHSTVLLPCRYVPESCEIGDELDVFVYRDNENRPVATTLKPNAEVGDFAFLTVKDVNKHGAFLDWGIAKDLFVPYAEQRAEMNIGQQYLVHIFIDSKSGRIAATEKFGDFIDRDTSDLAVGDEVELLIAEKTDLGFKAIADNRYGGLLYKNEIFEELKPGDRKRGFIRLIREDGKIDLRLQNDGVELIDDSKRILLDRLRKNNGLLPVGDKTSPEEIYKLLKMSKKSFKKAAGGLYREKLATISDSEIRLIKNS